MVEPIFSAIEDVEVTELSAARRGLLLTTRAEPYGQIIVTTSHGRRIAIYPFHKNPFLYIIAEEQRPDKPGVLFYEPAIEVDHTSMFDSRTNDQIGDLIVTQNGVFVVAQHPDGMEDSERIALWSGLTTDAAIEIGFRRWRMVDVREDGSRHVLFTHPKAGSDQPL